MAISGNMYMPEVVCTFLAAFVDLPHLVLVKTFSSVRESVFTKSPGFDDAV